MKTFPSIRVLTCLVAAAVLPGCAHDRAAASRPTRNSGRPVVYTGSHVPQDRNRVTTAPLSANIPPESVSRHPDSLVPSEPVVGATDNTTH